MLSLSRLSMTREPCKVRAVRIPPLRHNKSTEIVPTDSLHRSRNQNKQIIQSSHSCPITCQKSTNRQLSRSYQLNPKFFNKLYVHLKSPPSLIETRKIHGVLLVNGFFHPNSTDEVFGSQLVNIYVGFGSFHESLIVFNDLPQKNNLAWNSILRGLVNTDRFSETIDFFHLMLREGATPDNFTYPLVLKACSGLSALEEGRRVHQLIQFFETYRKIKCNIFVESAIISMFAKCGSVDEARQVFEKMPTKDLVSWSVMICGAAQSGEWCEALCLFKKMRLEGLRPDSVIVAAILPACGRLGVHRLGISLQGCAIRSGFDSDLFVSNALIDMYCKCAHTYEAHCIFLSMLYRDVVSWSTLIAGHSQNGKYRESLELYIEMMASGIRSNAVTVASVLPSFANLELLKQGKEMHSHILRHGFESDTFVNSALIDLYAHCGSMREAESIFETMPRREITIWNSMIAGYAANGEVGSAFLILRKLQEFKLRPNSITIVSILPLCTRIGILRWGKEIHGYVTRNGIATVVSVENSLIDMYSKCGYLKLGGKVFDRMIEKDVVTYNTIIAAYGIHGHGEQAFSYFDHMKESEIRPSKITFIALLAACSHAGLVDKGWFFYHSMTNDYHIQPGMDHYSCMVDLLGRAGHLDEAYEFIKMMPVEPEVDVLGSLLGACKLHNEIELAQLVGMQILLKNPKDPGYHVLLSNMYASTGRWTDAREIRTMIKEKGLIKKPGCSWIQIGSFLHLFHAKCILHPGFSMISEILETLLLEMKNERYTPERNLFLHDHLVDDNFDEFTKPLGVHQPINHHSK